jgi:hypothetical protein
MVGLLVVRLGMLVGRVVRAGHPAARHTHPTTPPSHGRPPGTTGNRSSAAGPGGPHRDARMAVPAHSIRWCGLLVPSHGPFHPDSRRWRIHRSPQQSPPCRQGKPATSAKSISQPDHRPRLPATDLPERGRRVGDGGVARLVGRM